jgi:hypothetical protein
MANDNPYMRKDASTFRGTAWGARIVELLDNRPQSWLAKTAKMSPSTLHDIITKNMPSAENAIRIAQTLGTTVEYIISGTEPAGLLVSKAAEPPADWLPSDARVGAVAKSVGERVRNAELAIEEASQETAIIPDEGLRQVMISLHVRYGVDAEDLAMLLHAAQRGQLRRS